MKSKVLFVCPTGDLNSGGESSNFELIKYLVEKKYSISVITSWQGEYNKVLSEKNIDNTAGCYKWWADWDDPSKTATQSISSLKVILEKIKNYKPDVIVTNTLNIPWGALAASLTNTPHIWIGREFPEGEFEYLDEKMQFINKFSNCVIANSKQLANFISHKYDFTVNYFYSYVDTDSLELGNGGMETRLVSVNGITARKNQSELIYALSILKKLGEKPIKTILIGSTGSTYEDTLRGLVNQLDLGGYVEFQPFSAQPWLAVSENDILIQTSLSESIGRTTTEAMKLGVPVIASDIPGHIEAFELGGGTLYKSGSPHDLAVKIKDALKDRKKTNKQAQLAKVNALRNMSKEACSQPFVAAIESVYGKKNPVQELSQVKPYIHEYLAASVNELILSEERAKVIDQQKLLIERQEEEMVVINSQLTQIKNSRAYRLAGYPGRVLNKIKSL